MSIISSSKFITKTLPTYLLDLAYSVSITCLVNSGNGMGMEYLIENGIQLNQLLKRD